MFPRAKFQTPSLNAKRMLVRPRLHAYLDAGAYQGLSCVVAPAGFGKTTLVAQWLHEGKHPRAWVSLDVRDRELQRLARALARALAATWPGVGASLDRACSRGREPGPEELAGSLIEDIEAEHRESRLHLVLDDLHRVSGDGVHALLRYLLDYRPDPLSIILVSREAPDVRTWHRRAQGGLAELGPEQLAFEPGETTRFLREQLEIDVDDETVEAIQRRTEGWPAATHLVASAMRGRTDADPAARRAQGEKWAAEYLGSEVLARQEPEVQRFLLETSVLTPLHPALCQAETAHPDALGVLRHRERDAGFVHALDDRRQWYRCHDLLREAIQHAAESGPSLDLARARRRAAIWLESRGHQEEALDQWVALREWDRAAALIETAAFDRMREGDYATPRDWLDRLPDEVVESRSALLVIRASAARDSERAGSMSADLDAAQDLLTQLATLSSERLAELGAKTGVPDAATLDSLRQHVVQLRALHATTEGEYAAAGRIAEEALASGAPREGSGRALLMLGISQMGAGEVRSAARSLERAIWHSHREEDLGNLALATSLAMSSLREAGDLCGALRTADRVMRRLEERGQPMPPGVAWFRGSALETHRERNELDRARACLELYDQPNPERPPFFEPVRESMRYRLLRAERRMADARRQLDVIERLLSESNFGNLVNLQCVLSGRAELALDEGRLAPALHWARSEGTRLEAARGFLYEAQQLVLARVWVAAGGHERALELLRRIVSDCEASGRLTHALRARVLIALAEQEAGDRRAADAELKRALEFSQVSGHVRAYLDLGAPVASLLERAVDQRVCASHARELLEQLRAEQSPGDVPEPLTRRELEVLGLIELGLSNAEIAGRLHISPGTAKTHTRSIFRKLSVSRRTQAVATARALNLL